MAEIIDPAVNAFLNEQVRPMSEAARSFKLRLHSLVTDWTAKYEALLASANDKDVINDGRDVQGVPFRTVEELKAWIAVFRKVVDPATDEWDDALVAKFCVRALAGV